MDSYQFFIDQSKPVITIDCSSYQRALFSLAALLQREPDELITTIYRIGNSLKGNHIQGVFEEVLAERVIGKEYLFVNVDNICWFHLTRTSDSLTFEEGLLPLDKNISKVCDFLFQVFDSVDPKISTNLRAMRMTGVLNSQFAWRMNSEFDQGPFGMLVRDTGFYWKDIGNVDYFGGAEIVQDICIAYEYSYGQCITPLFLKNTFPCIVSFIDECDIEDIEGIVRSIISYLFFRPQGTMVSCWCYNGRGKIIPRSSILKVEDNPLLNDVPFEYQQLFNQKF